ncbi:MAG: tetratricopeptide repeat protein [Hoeflea sp.]|uniref:tetratricopeptide repeat protein n=1 Tax=Hoeflea sp. TaxID=1940281 RepID=UPI0032EE1AA2
MTFFIGAGCSVSAGVPSGAEIARNQACILAQQYGLGKFGASGDAEKAVDALVNSKAIGRDVAGKPKFDWGKVYDAIFGDVLTAPDDARGVFKTIIRDNNPKINWAHLALGELAAQNWISTTISTNFDLLALEGYARAGVIPVVSDGLESLDRIDSNPEYPQLLQINGSVHTYRLRNRPDELEELRHDDAAVSCFRNLYQSSRAFVVVGYAGREPPIMDLLINAARAYPDKHVFWCLYSQNPADLSEKARKFLSGNPNARLLIGQNADLFFLELCKQLGVGSPLMFRDPVGLLMRGVELMARPDEAKLLDITQEIDALKKRLENLRSCEAEQAKKAPFQEKSRAGAREARLRGDLDESERALESAGDSEPDDELLNRVDSLIAAGKSSANSDKLLNALTIIQRRLQSGNTPDPESEYKIRLRRAKINFELGKRAANLDKLQECINELRDLLRDDHSKFIMSEKLQCQLLLGNALSELGGREKDTESLHEATYVLRGMIDEFGPEIPDAFRANASVAMGRNLAELGRREKGAESFEAAIEVYERALTNDIRGRAPLDWAGIQFNLGTALWQLGERDSGRDRLEQAVAAYGLALEEWTRERVPLDWAKTQNNLGNALQSLGQRDSGTERLEQAVAAYGLALEEWTRERVPLDWAKTQTNLGTALATLGERENSTDRLEQAVVAYSAALEECTRERVPLDWATTQNNLGNALAILGQRDGGTERLEQAVAAYRAALEEWTRERVPLDWAKTQTNLGTALQTLGERESGTERLEQAVAAYRAALEEWTRDRVPLDWAATQNNLGTALLNLGQRDGGTERLEQAVAAYRAALEERTRDRVPYRWAQTRENMSLALEALFRKTGKEENHTEALRAVQDALEVYREAGAEYDIGTSERLLAWLQGGSSG